MLGTILGMVRLLSTLEDPSHIGPHMSLALLTTFYGLFFSLVFWTPLQQKIERMLDVELEHFNQTIHWLETLENNKPISYFAEPIGIKTPRAA
jgi:chemotaxis protein MotA